MQMYAHTHTHPPLPSQTHIYKHSQPASQPSPADSHPSSFRPVPHPSPIVPFSPPRHLLQTPSPLSTFCSAHTHKKDIFGGKQMNMCWPPCYPPTKKKSTQSTFTHMHKNCVWATKQSSVVISNSVSSLVANHSSRNLHDHDVCVCTLSQTARHPLQYIISVQVGAFQQICCDYVSDYSVCFSTAWFFCLAFHSFTGWLLTNPREELAT